MGGAFCEDFDDVCNADFCEGLDGFDDSELKVEAFVAGPFHAALGFCEYVDGGEESLGRVFAGVGKEFFPKVLRDALAIGGGVEFGDKDSAEAADELAEELREFTAAFGFSLDEFEGGGCVAGEEF